MLILTFLIPIVCAIIILIFFNKKAVWWEYLILIVPSLLISTAIYFGMVSYSESDTEYLGEYVTEVKYYEPWDEYIHKTCSRTVRSGKHSLTEYYDCSYVEHHEKEWKQVLSNGYEYSITESEYVRLTRLWKTTNTFIDMNRNYYSYDGDCYSKKWDNNKVTGKSITFDQTYKNKVRVSHSIFGFSNIKPEEAKKMGLFDYPDLYSQGGFSGNDMNQTPILGKAPTSKELQKWEFLNGYYGKTKQFRGYVLFFYNKPQSIVQDQRSYWEGGNKNEFIMCIGLNKQNEIQWVDAFSWSDKPELEVNFRDHFLGKKKVDLSELADWLVPSISKYWHRKEFKDFDYINVELTNTQITWLFVLILIFNICMSVFIVMNSVEYEKDSNGKHRVKDNWL